MAAHHVAAHIHKGAASDQGSVDVANSIDIVLISLAPNLLSCA
jgi:hypothetical protein